MKISIIGTGYVGLVSGVCLAKLGHQVQCVDVDASKVDLINSGISPIYEKGLDALLKKNAGTRLKATTDLSRAVHDTELSIIAVGTPFDGHEIDLSYIRQVSDQIGAALRTKASYHVVVVKSTVVPGTTDGVVKPILEKASGKKAGKDFGVGMNPEFLREGEAVSDFMSPDRIVLGALDSPSLRLIENVYAPFDKVDKLCVNLKTAEMIKYTANSLLATMISFSNEIANLCKRTGDVDVKEVMQGVHLDKRLSPLLDDGRRIVPAFTTYIEAGCGFGGSCFPKDVKALIAYGKTMDQPMHLLDAVIKINKAQPQQIISMLKKHFQSLTGVRVSILGLAFKPETDDMRESPAIPVVKDLLRQGAQIKAYDPVAHDEAQQIFGDHNITLCESLEEAVKDAEAIVIMTRWDQFTDIPDILDQLNQSPIVIDGRRILEKSSVKRYEGIGL